MRPSRPRRSYSHVTMNERDRRRKVRLKARGLCTICGRKPLEGSWKCADCKKRDPDTARARMQKKLGSKPWVEGRQGRSPIDAPPS